MAPPSEQSSDDGRIEIDAEEYEQARRDPKVIAVLKEAQEYAERLRREGRDHTGGEPCTTLEMIAQHDWQFIGAKGSDYTLEAVAELIDTARRALGQDDLERGVRPQPGETVHGGGGEGTVAPDPESGVPLNHPAAGQKERGSDA